MIVSQIKEKRLTGMGDVLGCPRKLVNGYYMGYNLLTNHLLTFGDIQVGSFLFEKGKQPCRCDGL